VYTTTLHYTVYKIRVGRYDMFCRNKHAIRHHNIMAV
jgi:hypothetical protein